MLNLCFVVKCMSYLTRVNSYEHILLNSYPQGEML